MKWFSEKLLAIEMNKTEVQTIKEVYLGLPGSKMSKIVMYEYWYDYTHKSRVWRHGKIVLHGYRQFHIVHAKSECIYAGLAEDVEKRFDTSNHEVDRILPIG